ncbi:MAG: cob(I)yrinic acid a,c-diamide adenosyltransferase [Saprospiraceae bacterium]|nr:cob(I)yrinic acid a,c-diamide adenosyltransferase [Saprospiraceae bacterium]
MKIYTKTGDRGETALFGGRRVLKSHLRVDTYGTVDELNAYLGWLRDLVEPPPLREMLAQIQHRLFTVGAHLASDPQNQLPTPDLLPQDLESLEMAMDTMDAALPPLRNFILPGGHPAVSACHVCRTVCRRAERLVVALHETEMVEPIVLQYLNRLSDYFFLLARQLAHDLGAEEVIWKTRG